MFGREENLNFLSSVRCLSLQLEDTKPAAFLNPEAGNPGEREVSNNRSISGSILFFLEPGSGSFLRDDLTGANQGGKSTFLRSIGLSQLMMQAGMFVPANSFSANICNRLFTHYRREEDVTMKSGKLDEELSRMSEIVHDLTTDSLLLFNEFLAATTLSRPGRELI